MRKTILGFILLFVLATQTGAVNYYISQDGNDGNTGLDSANAWVSIDNGDQTGALIPGDTVFIYPGIYFLSSGLQLKTDGTADQPIIYKKFGQQAVIIDDEEGSEKLITAEGNHVKIDGLELRNSDDYGILLKADSSVITNCYIHNVKEGIRVEGSGNLILKNTITLIADHGINNRDAALNTRIYGNTIFSCNKNGIEFQGSSISSRIFNNIITFNDKGINGGAENVCGFNNVWSNPSGNYSDGVVDSAGGLSVDPLFADTSSEDFSLMAGSPCIDAGLDLGYYFAQAAPDMGAIEKYNIYYVSTSGDDSNDGLSVSTAWATIDNDNTILYPGDTINVLPGTYTDSVIISVSGAENDKIVFTGVRDSTLIDGTLFSDVVSINASYIVWSGISVFDAAATNISITGENNTIEYCRFRSADDRGIHVKEGDDNLIVGSVIDSSQVYGLFVASNCSNTSIINCTFYGNASAGIFDQSGETNIVNSIFDSNTGSGVRSPKGNVVFSTFYNNGTDVVGGIDIDSTCLFDNPLLINPDSGNFRLSALSPAINAGTDIGLPYSGDAPDMGAYEMLTLALLAIIPDYDSLNADSTYQFSITALDSSGLPADPGQITWSHIFPTGSINASGLFTPQLVDSGKVIAVSSLGGISDTTDFMFVIAGILDSMSITPDRDTIKAGLTRQFTANGFDAKGNSVAEIGTITWKEYGSIGTIDTTGLFTATKTGTGYIEAKSDLGSKPKAETDTIFVIAGDIAYIETTPSATSVEIDSTFQFYAAGYDVNSNLVYDITDSVVWTTTDPAGNVDASGLYTAGSVPSPPTFYIKAVYSGSFSDSSSVTIIGVGALSYIKIELFDGTEFGDSTLSADNDTTKFYCRGYDVGSTFIGNVSVTWSVIGDDSIGTVIAGPDAVTSLILSNIGTGKAVATHSSGFADTTGIITCTAGLPAILAVSPDTATISADSSLDFSITVYDADGNPSDSIITPNWSVLGGIGSIEPDGHFTPSTMGMGYIIASENGLTDTSGQITVMPGILDNIVITPNSIDIGVGDSILFNAAGYDAKSNSAEVGNLTWLVLGQIGNIDSTGLFTADQPGVCSVMVISSINNITDISSAVNVKALYVSEIPLGNITVNPGQDLAPIVVFRIDNNYDEDKSINSITVRNNSFGVGSIDDLLTNIDSVSLYYDSDNDSILTDSDSLIAISEVITDAVTLSFSPLTIQSDLGRTFFLSLSINPLACDNDSLDFFFFPATDILTEGGISIDGPDSLNSLGYNIINGLVARQLSLIATGNTQVNPGDSVFNVLTVDIPRNGYLEDTINIFSLLNNGTAITSDIDSLILFSDDGNNIWDGPEVETKIDILTFTGSHWMRSGLNIPLVEPANRFYIGVKVADYPTNGATLELTIPNNGLEMASQNDGPIDSALTPVETIEIVTSEEVSVIALTVLSLELVPGEDTNPLLGIELTNSYGLPVIVDSLRFNLYADDPGGATQEQLDSQIDSIMIYVNRDNDHTITSGFDSILAAGNINNGIAVFNLNGFTIPASGVTRELSIVAGMNLQNSKNGNSINIGINDVSDIYLSVSTINGIFPIVNGDDHVINSFTTSHMNINPVEATTLFGGQTEQLVFDFELPRDGYASTLFKSMKLENVGTVNDMEALENVKLWSDLTNNGFTDDDSLLGNLTYNGNDWEISGLTYPLNGVSNRFLATVDIINEQFEGGTLQFRIPIEGVTYWSGTTGPDDTDTGNPDAHLVFSSNRVTVISLPAPSKTLSPGSIGTMALTYALYNGYVGQDQILKTLTLSNISRTSSGQAYADYELGQVYLYLDSDSNRIFGNDSLIAVGYFTDGILQLAGLNIILTPEVLSYFFVVIDIPLNTTDSDSLAVAISNPSDFVFLEPANINGDLPVVSGGYLILDGSIGTQYELIEIQPKTLSPGDTSVTLFAFHPAINGEMVDTLQSLTIANLGNADTSDITPLELWLDSNNDSVWQATDSLAGVLSYLGTEWQINSLNLIIDAIPPVLFLIGDVSLTASSDAVFQAQIPINGCQYSSDNDGPYDVSISSSYSFTISNSGLRIDYTPLRETFSVGQSIEVKMAVTNLLTGTTMDSVYGEIIGIDDSTIVTLTDNSSGPVTLLPGDSTEFTFTYTADSAGQVSWDLRAVAPIVSDTSVTMQTNRTNLQVPPSGVPVQLINSIPTSVTRGQVNVFPMGLSITHPDTSSNAASLRLDSLLINVSDGSGMALTADDVFSRMVLTTGYVNLSILESVPMQSIVSFIFSEPVIIDPGETQVFSLLVDIDSTTILNSFALSIEDVTAIPVTDNNTLQPVTLDAGIVFPLTTASCNIDTPSHQMAISYSTLHNGFANYDQNDVETIQLNLFHPGDAGNSPIQLAGLSFRIIDDDSIPILPSNLFENIKFRKQQVTIASLFESDLDSVDLNLTLNAPIILNPGERDSITITASLKDESAYSNFNILFDDSTAFLVRDLSSGLHLNIVTDTTFMSGSAFPISSGLISIKQPAIPPEICVSSLLPSSIVGGTDSLELLELSLVYPPGGDHSSVMVNSVLISVLDSLGSPLDPNQLFDRIGTKTNSDTIVYMPYVRIQGGHTVFELGGQGLLLNQGDSTTISLVGDIERDVPYDNFVLSFHNDISLLLYDITDTDNCPGYTVSLGCVSTLPYTTAATMIFLPAGRPVISSQSLPVQIAYPGQTGLIIYDEIWTYSSPTLQGDLAIHGIQGQFMQRTVNGIIPVNGNKIFEAVYLLMADQFIAGDTAITDDTLRLIFDADYVLNRGDNVNVRLECDLKATAAEGNYFIQFNDSTFMDITDRDLATVIYPVHNDSYPVKTVELSISSVNLESSYTNYPNPFNPMVDGYTTIGFNLSEAASIDIEIFTITGEIVSEIALNSDRLSGPHQSDTWKGTNDVGFKVISGTYLCRITARYDSGRTEEFIRKIAVIR